MVWFHLKGTNGRTGSNYALRRSLEFVIVRSIHFASCTSYREVIKLRNVLFFFVNKVKLDIFKGQTFQMMLKVGVYFILCCKSFFFKAVKIWDYYEMAVTLTCHLLLF